MDVTGKYHKAIVAAVAGGLVGAISVITGAMGPADTFGDIPTETWLIALGTFLVGSGLTGGTVAASKANSTSYPANSPQQAEGGAPVYPSQSTGAPQSAFPQEAGSGAPPTTNTHPVPGGAPTALPGVPENPDGQKG